MAVGLVLSEAAGAQGFPRQEKVTLDRAVTGALASHPTVRSARAGAAAADAAAAEARARRWPDVALRASLTRFQEPMIVAPLHRFDVTQVPQFDRTLIGGDLSLRYTLFDGGARVAQVRRTEAEAAAAALEHTTSEQRLIADVAGAYLSVLTASGIGEAQESRTRALQAERARVAQLLETGSAAQVELLRAEAALAQAEAERITTAAALDLAERNLARLVGADVEAVRAGRLEPISLRHAVALDDRALLIDRAVAGNPAVVQAQERVRAARGAEQGARAAWFPQLHVAAGYVAFAAADANASAEWQAGIRLSYPIFTGGRRGSAVRRARAGALLAAERQRLAELATGQHVDRAVNAVREWRARISAGTIAVDHLTEVARIEQLALAEGVGTQIDYLRAEADLLRARAQLIEAHHAEIAAWVALAQTTGELSAEWLRQTLESGS
jgi:outer membrane protein